ncbi:translocation/assembly module TamB domain-containing protein [Sphingobacterium alkalisoli]|uniref:translocation/assembly module TamB domain-containing protein n=1 Tax=Sphingobacterium alkalisoli TaxID=1874115 RepID=UPI004032944C
MKKILKITLITLTSIFLLVILALFSLQFSAVQTYVSKKVAAYLSEQLDSKIRLQRVYFKPFSAIQLQEFELLDNKGNQIIYVESLDAYLVLREFFNKKIRIEEIKLKNAYVDFQIYEDSTNFSKVITYFSPKNKQLKTSSKKKLALSLDKVVLENNHIRLVNHRFKHHNRGVDFSDLDITHLSGVFDNIKFDSLRIASTISNLTFKEKSGLHLQELSTDASYSDKKMEFKEFYLVTNNSELRDYLLFEYESINDFQDFINKVHVTSRLTNSNVDSRDIEFFAPSMKNIIFQTDITKATLSGTVAHIRAEEVQLKTSKNTELIGNFTVNGLPYIEHTLFDFDLDKLHTHPNDIEYLVPLLANSKTFKLPEQVHRFNTVVFQGKFHGRYNDFLVNGMFQTALGELKTTSKISIKNRLSYSGHIQSKNFQIGKLINTEIIENTGLDLSYEGSGLLLNDLVLAIDGNIQNTTIKNYNYDLIVLRGNIKDKILQVEGNIEDENLQLVYASDIDLNSQNPTYQLDGKINFAALNKLNWVTKDSIIIHHANLKTNLSGNALNNLIGGLNADSIQMTTTRGYFNINELHFSAEGDQQDRLLTLNSDVVDAKMQGNIDLNTIGAYFRSLAMRYAPAIGIEVKPFNPQNFDLDLNIKSFEPVAALLDPSLTLDDGAHLNASFSTTNYTAKFTGFSPSLTYKGIKVTNLAIAENADESAFSLNVTADKLNFSDSAYINHIAIKNVLTNDSLHFNIEMSEKKATNYLNLNGNIHFAHNKPAYIKFSPSTILINRENWLLNNDAQLHVSKGKIYINNLLLSQARQRVRLDGIVSDENDKLNMLFDNFSLTSLNGLTNPLGVQLRGFMNGKMELNSILKQPFVAANIQTTPIIYNDIPIGQLNLIADFDPESGLANVDLKLLDSQNRGVSVEGDYNLSNDDEPLNLKGNLNETDLIIFQPFLKNLVSNLEGKANADVSIVGTFRNPKISGIGRFKNAEVTVNYLKTHYRIENQPVLIQNNAVMLQNLKLFDDRGSTATANGIIDLAKLINPYIDVDVTGNNFMILNTNYKDNNLYYGTAYASGKFRFKGFTSSIDIDIDAKSEANTVLTIPFNSAMTIAESDFIYFVGPDTTENNKKGNKNLFTGLTMNMDLELTPEAELNLQTEPGSLKGSGAGEVTLRISSLGDFEMFGDYVINSGKFHFTAQDFINKYFDIKEGGTVRWTGTPREAVINLNAIYQQRTAVGPLYNAAGRSGEDERVLAQADMIIKGTLQQPDITFDLNFPQNPYIKDQLQSYLSDVNNINQQALSLIVRRSFTPSSTNDVGREVNNTLLSAGTEIAFNQLNNIISQSLNVNFFDLNIRSLNDASASVRLLNDRLVLTGGITDRRNYQATDLTFFSEGFATDAELTYRLRKDGNLMLRAYNRPYTRNFLIRANDAEYISALGLVYRQEFNSIQEFWRKLWYWGDKKDNP